jgi:hypothetical protein
MSSVQFLKYNLNEIHAASLTDHSELVSNLKSTRVYHTKNGWGRLWVWFYKLTKPLYKEDKQATCLRKCITQISVIFENEKSKVTGHIDKFEEYLRLRTSSTKVDEKDFHTARRSIKDWGHTSQFLKTDSIQKKISICKKYLGKDDPAPEFTSSHKTSLSSLLYLLKLEGKQQGPLPLDLVSKLLTKQSMQKEEMTKLVSWISKFKKVRPIHKFLTEFSKHIINPDIIQFELTCLKNECYVFKKPDPKHLKWRESLKSGDCLQGSIRNQLQNITIGDSFGKKESQPDEQIFFTIKEHPDKLLMISSNRALLALKMKWASEGGWALRSPIFDYIDPKGKFAIIEKFRTPLSSLAWTSTSILKENEKNIALPIANYVKWLQDQNMSVTNLNPEYVMFDSTGKLRAAKNQERIKYDFVALEKFIQECSHNNLTVFQYLMKASGLWESKHGCFFRGVVADTLYEENVNISLMASARGVIDQKDLKQAEELRKSILMLRDKLAIEFKFDKKHIGKHIEAVYLELKASFTLWPTFEELVKKHMIA